MSEFNVHNIFITLRGGSEEALADYASRIAQEARRIAKRARLTIEVAQDMETERGQR